VSAYISLGALKAAVALSPDDTNDDALLSSVIFRASGLVDSFLAKWRVGYVGFAHTSNSRTAVGSNSRIYDGDGTGVLFIDDFASVASVAVDGTEIPTTSYKVLPHNSTPKRWLQYTEPDWDRVGVTNDAFPRGTGNVTVTGYAGLDHVPDDVAQTTLAIALILWRRYQSGEQEPVVRPDGVQGFIVQDPEIDGILSTGLQGWVSLGVWGA
jgi:hypothetical protein